VSGFDAVDGGSADDCNGHGTHVAGTIGGATYGVAKGVTLVGVRVLGCNGSGTISGVIAGVNWVTSNHQAGRPAVANMSLVGGASSALDTAVRNSIADGVSYAVAAGNGNCLGIAQNACNYPPARVGEAMTISATDSSDRKASWANRGELRRLVRARRLDHVRLAHELNGYEDDQRDVHGHSAHGRSCRSLSAGKPRRLAGGGAGRAVRPDDEGRRDVVLDHEQPPALHEPLGKRGGAGPVSGPYRFTRKKPCGARPATLRVTGSTGRPSSSRLSLRLTALRTTKPPTYRIGSGGKRPVTPRFSPEPDHSSSRPSALEARIFPAVRHGATPFPEKPTP
jgi:Subtilase family